MSYKLKTMSIIIPVGILVTFVYWYQWSSQILSSEEVNTYMNIIEMQTKYSSAKHDLPALRKFLSEDDGKPIYTVNLYSFHSVANYPKSSEFKGSGEQAYDRFSQTMIPLMLKRGSHPIYASYWSDLSSGKWDRIVIVRYRSRRDLVDIFATKDFADASIHKWASIKEHERMLVQAIHIPNALFFIPILAAIVGVIILVTGQYRKYDRSPHS